MSKRKIISEQVSVFNFDLDGKSFDDIINLFTEEKKEFEGKHGKDLYISKVVGEFGEDDYYAVMLNRPENDREFNKRMRAEEREAKKIAELRAARRLENRAKKANLESLEKEQLKVLLNKYGTPK